MNFKELYLAGEIDFEAIDDYICQWNNSDNPSRLAEFLGLNEEEEAVWIDVSDDALEDLLSRQKNKPLIYKSRVSISLI